MKKIVVIPSRYDSTRLPGKGLLDINGKPMIWWVYQQCKKAHEIDDVILAIDHEATKLVCEQHNLKYVMTSSECPSHVLRIYEVSTFIEADLYVEVCGDEPMIESTAIDEVASQQFNPNDSLFFQAYTDLVNPLDAYDFTTNKFVTDINGNVLYFSRSPIPYPKGSREFTLKKGVGIHAFTKKALKFIYDHPVIGPLESIEQIDELRFLEYGHKVKAVKVNSKSKSVDTFKDLQYVRKIMSTYK